MPFSAGLCSDSDARREQPVRPGPVVRWSSRVWWSSGPAGPGGSVVRWSSGVWWSSDGAAHRLQLGIPAAVKVAACRQSGRTERQVEIPAACTVPPSLPSHPPSPPLARTSQTPDETRGAESARLLTSFARLQLVKLNKTDLVKTIPQNYSYNRCHTGGTPIARVSGLIRAEGAIALKDNRRTNLSSSLSPSISPSLSTPPSSPPPHSNRAHTCVSVVLTCH